MNTSKRVLTALAGGAIALLGVVGSIQTAQAAGTPTSLDAGTRVTSVAADRDLSDRDLSDRDMSDRDMSDREWSGRDAAAPLQAATLAAVRGCQVGYVCIYSSESNWNRGIVEHRYYTYGTHRLYDEYGNHWIYNNQTDNAAFRLCRGGNGTDCDGWGYPGGPYVIHLTQYNSIKLVP